MVLCPVDTDIEYVDPESDEEDNAPTTGVFVSIVTLDGMRYSGHVGYCGNPAPEVLARMVMSAGIGAGATHSPELADLLRCATNVL